MCGCGETGRRAGFKIRFRKECRFDSDHPHHLQSQGKSTVREFGSYSALYRERVHRSMIECEVMIGGESDSMFSLQEGTMARAR